MEVGVSIGSVVKDVAKSLAALSSSIEQSIEYVRIHDSCFPPQVQDQGEEEGSRWESLLVPVLELGMDSKEQ
jgi:hypothetical protein